MRLSANLGLGALLALVIVRLWLMPLPSSLWMDEAITAFLVQCGPAHPSLAALPALSPIYTALPRLLVAVFGFSEIALRLPSVLAMGSRCICWHAWPHA
jgi:uncharacterized membrane protein